MPTSTSPPRRRKTPNRRQAAATGTLLEPTPADRRRWEDLREGISPEELAARENVRLPTILKSRDIMRNYLARYSQQSAEVEVRRTVLDSLPAATNAFAEALCATVAVTKMVVKQRENFQTGLMEDYMDEETTLIADHATRMKATERLEKLFLSTQPKTPMVAVDARSQTNIQNGGGGNSLGSGQALSFEAITRQIRAERGLSLGPGEPTAQMATQPITAAPVEVDYELQEELAEEAADGDGDELEVAQDGEASQVS